LDIGSAFKIGYINNQSKIEIGDLSIEFFRTVHPIECYGFIVRSGVRKLVYTADTAYDERLIDSARSADLLLCEATFSEDRYLPNGLSNHLTSRTAAQIARSANVNRLILTHFWYQEEPDRMLNQALSIFPNTSLAVEFQTFEI